MKFPRYKAKNYEKRLHMAFEFSKKLMEELMEASKKSKVSDDDFKKCKEAIIEGSFSYADAVIKKANKK